VPLSRPFRDFRGPNASPQPPPQSWRDPADFRAALRSSVGTVGELEGYLAERGISRDSAGIAQLAEPAILPLRIPRYYLDLIDWSDPSDPLRRQILPLPDEQTILPDDLSDPIGDESHSPVPGLVHRYPDRALLLLTTACAVHCRFCFRREFVGVPARTLRPDHFEAALAYLASHPDVWEIILSGGDPLVFPDAYLTSVLRRLRAIPHLRVIRIHSRTPAVLPFRLTPELAELLRQFAPLYLVVHVNHPREVSPDFVRHVGYLVDRGIPVLSQSVLLRGVNDDVATLADLFRRLVEARIKPYYLHQLDRAPGTNQFRVPIADGLRLMQALRGNLSGLCLPTYMLDIPGGQGKVPLTPQYVHLRAPHLYDVVNHKGERFTYQEPSVP
jgi:lysine 2,3-aminomutase